MAAYAGKTAREIGDFRCDGCRQAVHVRLRDETPRCPACGNDTLDTRRHEPGATSS